MSIKDYLSRIRFAIVGCGAIAEDMHIPTTLSTPGAVLEALVDIDAGRRDVLASRYNISNVSAYIEELEGDIDAIILATPPHTHLSIAKRAFEAGMHVLCEKPLANTVDECEEMCNAASKAGRFLAVGHMCRFYPVRQRLREILDIHGLGRILRVDASEGKPYTWPVMTGYTFRKEMVPGGVLINAGIHTLDSLLYWLGDPLALSYEDDSIGGLESNCRLYLDFPNSIYARYRQSRTCNLPHFIRVEAEAGTVEVSTNSVDHYVIYSGGGRSEHLLTWGGRDIRDAWRDQLVNFIGAVRGGSSVSVDGEEGTRVIRLVETCYREKRKRPLPTRAPEPGMTW